MLKFRQKVYLGALNKFMGAQNIIADIKMLHAGARYNY